MRRILRKIAEGKIEEVGDTSTLADPAMWERLFGSEINPAPLFSTFCRRTGFCDWINKIAELEGTHVRRLLKAPS